MYLEVFRTLLTSHMYLTESGVHPPLSNIKVTDVVFTDDDVLLEKSLEVLVMALEVLHEEAKPLEPVS